MAKTRIAVGSCNEKNASFSGKKLAEKTLREGLLNRVDLALAFCAGGLNHHDFFNGLQSVIGTAAPVVGGSAIGVITNGYLSYEGFPAALALIESDNIRFRVAAAGDLDLGEQSAGRNLARALAVGPADRALLVFYDSLRHPATDTQAPVLNASAPLLAGLEEAIPSGFPILGAGLVGDYGFGGTNQFCGSYVNNQSAVGIRVSGNVEPYFCIMHGCRPLDGIYRTITKIEGSLLYELDGESVGSLIDELFGNGNWRNQRPLDYLTIGVNCGERYGEPQESKYVNRLIMGVTGDGKGISLFEPDLRPGTEIQFMLRDTQWMLDSARTNAAGLMTRIIEDGKKPVFGLYVDCAGRTAERSNTTREEAWDVQNILNSHGTPLLGFYSGVEISPLLGRSRGLDWTGVLCVLAEDA